jgi:hypothetical protein
MKTLYTPARIFALVPCPCHLKGAATNAIKINLCVVAFLAVVLCCGVAANAQSVTVSPGNLSFGVPTGSTVSAAEAVNISVSGSGNTLTNTNVTIAGTTDFAQTNTCSGTISAPGSCTVSVTFTPSAPAGTLESATLNVTYTTSLSGNGTASVPLTGALGAIRLFDPLNVANSNPGLSDANPLTFASTTLTLSCLASPTALLSSSPDGTGNVLVDNFVTLAVSGIPFGSGLPAGNVCTGGQNEGNGQQDCFTANYQSPAGQGQLNGDDPDTFTNAGNSVLQTYPSNAGGVSPINVQGAFFSGPQTAAFSLLDGGGFVTSTTLYLVTSCSLTNASSGTETGNSVSQQPSQTLNFDTVVGNLDVYSFDYSLVLPGSINNFNATPVVTNNSITPAEYAALVASTPFANTTCIPLASLAGNCALKTQVCTLPGGGAASGANCPQTSAPDFLFTSTFDPVTALSNPNSIFGFLEFNDAGSCPLEGAETGSSCPQNGLVSFSGPGMNTGRTGAGSTNSSRIVVAGITPPTTTVTVLPFYSTGPASGWTNGNPTATFVGNPAAITGIFTAPINFIDYGINPTIQGEPPTFPIPFSGNSTFGADNVLPNPATCPASYTVAPLPFTPAQVSLGTFADGSSNLLHYSSTDCAATHELQFTLTNGSWSTNWKSLTLQTDTQHPAISITAPAASTAYPAYQKVKAAYACTDTESGVASCTGTLPVNSYIDTTPTNGLSTPKSFTVNAVDNVGNAAPLTVNYSVSCNYAAVGISPSTVTRPALVGITASVIDCMSAPQNVKVQFSVSGPIGKNCSNASSVLLTTPPFTIKSGASNSITFPFPIGKNACAGTYTVTTTTLQGSTTIDTVNSMLTVH